MTETLAPYLLLGMCDTNINIFSPPARNEQWRVPHMYIPTKSMFLSSTDQRLYEYFEVTGLQRFSDNYALFFEPLCVCACVVGGCGIQRFWFWKIKRAYFKTYNVTCSATDWQCDGPLCVCVWSGWENPKPPCNFFTLTFQNYFTLQLIYSQTTFIGALFCSLQFSSSGRHIGGSL